MSEKKKNQALSRSHDRISAEAAQHSNYSSSLNPPTETKYEYTSYTRPCRVRTFASDAYCKSYAHGRHIGTQLVGSSCAAVANCSARRACCSCGVRGGAYDSCLLSKYLLRSGGCCCWLTSRMAPVRKGWRRHSCADARRWGSI